MTGQQTNQLHLDETAARHHAGIYVNSSVGKVSVLTGTREDMSKASHTCSLLVGGAAEPMPTPALNSLTGSSGALLPELS